jgi:hypothetical protein
MATDYIKTVKPTGGDYTKISTWESTEQQNLVTADRIGICECYKGDYSGINGGLNYIDDRCQVAGWTVDATRYIKIYAPSGQRHTGKTKSGSDYTGFCIKDNGSWGSTLNIDHDFTVIEALIVDVNSAGHEGAIDTVGGASSTIQENIICNVTATDVPAIWYGSTNKIYNNILHDVYCGMDGINWYSGSTIYNNTVIDFTTYGIAFSPANGGGSGVWKNNLCKATAPTACFYHNPGSTDPINQYNASSDATADDWDGTGCRINQTFTFANEANNDFHLASNDAGALNFGVDLSAVFTIDIDYATRPTGAGTWDIGADEYVSAGGGPDISQTWIHGVG